MYIKQQYVEAVYKQTEEKINSYVNADDMRNFQKLLNDIAKRRNYKEGETIIDNDLGEITRQVRHILNGMTSAVLEAKDGWTAAAKNNYDGCASLMTVNDHLFAMAMRTLGSPHMPAFFGEEVKEALDEYSSRLYKQVKSEISVDDVRRDQRGKNANQLKGELSSSMANMQEKKGTMHDTCKLVAEYQALKRRQNDHSFAWRLFHIGENMARNALLKEMKSTVRKAVGMKVKLDRRTPAGLAMALDKYRKEKALEAYTDRGAAARLGLPEDALGYEATISDRAMSHRDNNNLLSNDATQKKDAENLKNHLLYDLNKEEPNADKRLEQDSKGSNIAKNNGNSNNPLLDDGTQKKDTENLKNHLLYDLSMDDPHDVKPPEQNPKEFKAPERTHY